MRCCPTAWPRPTCVASSARTPCACWPPSKRQQPPPRRLACVDGIHDLGGMDGFGPVDVEPDEPVFHERWERQACGVTFATFAMGVSNGGQFRHSIERMDPAHYLASSYYEHWITGVATRLVETGRLTIEEMEARAGGQIPMSRPVHPDAAELLDVVAGASDARFMVDDRVRVRDVHPFGHTRCPNYVRGKTGMVVRVDGSFPVPDVEAHFEDRCSE